MKTQLKQHESWFNPMYLDGKEINHIIFFDNVTGETILEPDNTNVRWFGNNVRWFSHSNNDYPIICFDLDNTFL
jgi:hypothetical protein